MDILNSNVSGIYAISNKINGRKYVGSAVLIKRRWSYHLSALRHGKHHSISLQRSWDKNGESAFEWIVLEVVSDPQKLIDREQFWIDKLESYGKGYNGKRFANSMLGFKMSDAAKAKMAARKLGTTRVFTPEHKSKLAAAARRRHPILTPIKCRVCNTLTPGVKRRKFCSLACRAKALKVTIRCQSCGKKFSLFQSQSRRNGKPRRFCSRLCFNKSLNGPNPAFQLEFDFKARIQFLPS